MAQKQTASQHWHTNPKLGSPCINEQLCVASRLCPWSYMDYVWPSSIQWLFQIDVIILKIIFKSPLLKFTAFKMLHSTRVLQRCIIGVCTDLIRAGSMTWLEMSAWRLCLATERQNGPETAAWTHGGPVLNGEIDDTKGFPGWKPACMCLHVFELGLPSAPVDHQLHLRLPKIHFQLDLILFPNTLTSEEPVIPKDLWAVPSTQSAQTENHVSRG